MFKRFFNTTNTLIVLTLTLFLSLSTTGTAFSQDTYDVPQTAEVTLAWDANDPAPDGYRIYMRTDGTTYDYSTPAWTGTASSGTIYNLDYDTNYHFVVRAYVGSLESADSVEVSYSAGAPITQSYAIVATAGEHGAISPAGTQSLDEGANQVFAIVPESGYRIANVAVDGEFIGAVSEYTFSSIAADHTIHASFEVDTYTITASSGSNGGISPSGGVCVSCGENATFVITPDDGYQVANIFVDGSDVGQTYAYTFSNVGSDHTIVANFIPEAYQITATAGTNGSISPSGVTALSYGATQQYSIVPADGYHIEDVTIDGDSVGAVGTYSFSDITVDHSIHATFAADAYVISATAGSGGAVSPAGETEVLANGSLTYTINAEEGYQVADVVVDGESVGSVKSYTFSNVSGDHTLSALFTEAKEVTLQIEAEDGDLELPMEIGDDATASAGGYIWVEGELRISGAATYVIDIPVAGDYTIWGRLIATDTNSDTILVVVDGQAEFNWFTKISETGEWTWDVLSQRTENDSRVTTDPLPLTLGAGTHTIAFYTVESGLKLDKLLITNQTDMTEPIDPEGNKLLETIEFGDLQINHKWTRVNFTETFVDPVVVAGPATLNGGQPCIVRIRNVDTTGFDIRLQEWDYLDGSHLVETVSYMAMEAGSYVLSDGTRVEAANVSNAKVWFKNVPFKTTFNVVPVVMTSITSFNDETPVTGRVKEIAIDGFNYRIQEQEANANQHGDETFSYIAWEPMAGTVANATLIVAKSGNAVTHRSYTVNYESDFEAAPVFLADAQTTNGSNTANIRCKNRTATSVEVLIDEEQSKDSEVNHIKEEVGYFAIVR